MRLLLVFAFFLFSASAADRPNIVLIYTDDLGYGDLSCYGATQIKTPNIDRLAREGLRFTDAHSPSATCTPSRYAMLTGEYAFRKRGTGVLPGNAPLIIEPGRPNLTTPLKAAGYKTAVIGKWHLGLGRANMDWNSEIKPGPLELGFDYSFLMPATGDRVPTVYVENHRVINLNPADPIKVSFTGPIGAEPTGQKNPELLKHHPSHGHNQAIVNGVSRIGYQTGGKSALWNDETIHEEFLKRATNFIAQNKSNPFFLYFSTHDIHVPRIAHPNFAGKSSMGPRGDVILQLDWTVGELLKTLDQHNLANNTLIIFTSDNGPVIDDGYKDDAVEKLGAHKPAGLFRGGKYSLFEAGTRVPFIARWPARIKPGLSDALMSQVDFPATFAALVGQTFNTNNAPDTQNQLPALLGESKQGRSTLVHHANTLALRADRWKYIEPRNGPRRNANTNTETGADPKPQLYDLSTDPGETKNLAEENPEKLKELTTLLANEKAKGMPSPPRQP